MPKAHIPAELRRLVREYAAARCGYCHAEAFLGMPLDVGHLVPEAAGGPTQRHNLWLACSRCNDFKGDWTAAPDPETGEHVQIFNPRAQRWIEQSAWDLDGSRIMGRTARGRATVEALRLNTGFIVVARRFWVEAGRWPPEEDLLSDPPTASATS